MSIRLTSSGRSAKNATISDLQKAIAKMEEAQAWISQCQGMGAEIYTAKLQERIETYRSLKSKIGRIG